MAKHSYFAFSNAFHSTIISSIKKAFYVKAFHFIHFKNKFFCAIFSCPYNSDQPCSPFARQILSIFDICVFVKFWVYLIQYCCVASVSIVVSRVFWPYFFELGIRECITKFVPVFFCFFLLLFFLWELLWNPCLHRLNLISYIRHELFCI